MPMSAFEEAGLFVAGIQPCVCTCGDRACFRGKKACQYPEHGCFTRAGCAIDSCQLPVLQIIRNIQGDIALGSLQHFMDSERDHSCLVIA